MSIVTDTRRVARKLHIAGVVQGVGFRPYVFRLARTHGLMGWVVNGGAGVEIHVEGPAAAVHAFIGELTANAPCAAEISTVETECDSVNALNRFEIRRSESDGSPVARVAPDMAICDACLKELFDPADQRFRYPYINCTNCGPRFSIVRALPYDRAQTTMADWPLCAVCAAEYGDVDNRRFHAQPVACSQCGPGYRLVIGAADSIHGHEAIETAARLLSRGRILALKGIGGYHLACDADRP